MGRRRGKGLDRWKGNGLNRNWTEILFWNRTLFVSFDDEPSYNFLFPHFHYLQTSFLKRKKPYQCNKASQANITIAKTCNTPFKNVYMVEYGLVNLCSTNVKEWMMYSYELTIGTLETLNHRYLSFAWIWILTWYYMKFVFLWIYSIPRSFICFNRLRCRPVSSWDLYSHELCSSQTHLSNFIPFAPEFEDPHNRIFFGICIMVH